MRLESIIATCLTLFLGYWGFRVTLREPTSRHARLRQEIGFALVTLVAVVLIVRQDVLRDKQAELLQQVVVNARQEATAAKSEAENARNESRMARSEAAARDEESRKDRGQLLEEFRATKKELEPFVELAKRRYPALAPSAGLVELAKEVREAKEMAAPPTLSLSGCEVSQEAGNEVVIVQFAPSKNQPLGQIEFTVTLAATDDARILDLWPPRKTTPFSYGDQSKFISIDGKLAKLTYQLLMVGYPTLQITISKPAPINIAGNYLVIPVHLEPSRCSRR